jgi:hypothetical protein
MAEIKNLDDNLGEIVSTFELSHNENCGVLLDWIEAKFELNDFELTILADLHKNIVITGEYMNEEELKAKMVGLIFYASKIEEPKQIMVFYERALSGEINNIPLSVICDCVVATPLVNAPRHPYFFLQEFKKSKGEKKDPEAQMLIAMLLAQQKNNDNKPVYGGYLIGTGWHFATLIGNDYCVSRRIEATQKDELFRIVYTLKQLKQLIINA